LNNFSHLLLLSKKVAVERYSATDDGDGKVNGFPEFSPLFFFVPFYSDPPNPFIVEFLHHVFLFFVHGKIRLGYDVVYISISREETVWAANSDGFVL